MPKYAMKTPANKRNKPKAAKSLKGKQSKIDANKDGKISKKDFAMLKKKKK
jgi:hypothetical protein|tara:strand:+ start:561 stop:713 length:153 start_codon:yes stop_codon:yes gene_type:complete